MKVAWVLMDSNCLEKRVTSDLTVKKGQVCAEKPQLTAPLGTCRMRLMNA